MALLRAIARGLTPVPLATDLPTEWDADAARDRADRRMDEQADLLF